MFEDIYVYVYYIATMRENELWNAWIWRGARQDSTERPAAITPSGRSGGGDLTKANAYGSRKTNGIFGLKKKEK